MRLVPGQVELFILGLDSVCIDRHVVAGLGLEPDDACAAAAAARDA
jgi:hypothetical protein